MEARYSCTIGSHLVSELSSVAVRKTYTEEPFILQQQNTDLVREVSALFKHTANGSMVLHPVQWVTFLTFIGLPFSEKYDSLNVCASSWVWGCLILCAFIRDTEWRCFIRCLGDVHWVLSSIQVEYLREELGQAKAKLAESEFFREKALLELRWYSIIMD